MKNNILNIRSTKFTGRLLLLLMILLYVLENSFISKLMNGVTFHYIIRPISWIGLISIVWMLPRVKIEGKIKFQKHLYFWAFNFAIIYIMILMLAGVIDGLGKSPYAHSIWGILMNGINVVPVLIGREFVRNYLVNHRKKKESYFYFVLIALLMTITSISFHRYTKLEGLEGIVKFIAQYFAPEFAQNFFATYLVFLGGPLCSIIYLGVLQGFHWLSPILPDLKWITAALIGILCPMFFYMALQNIYLKISKSMKKRDEKEENPVSWIITSVVSIAIVWFAVGVFPIYPSVIATGSMEPMIYPGDVILVDKVTEESLKDLMVGDVIQFKRDSILISHRIMEIKMDQKTQEISYITKGDNNSSEDHEPVKLEQIRGKITFVVPKVGWPTLFIKSRNEIPLEKVEF